MHHASTIFSQWSLAQNTKVPHTFARSMSFRESSSKDFWRLFDPVATKLEHSKRPPISKIGGLDVRSCQSGEISASSTRCRSSPTCIQTIGSNRTIFKRNFSRDTTSIIWQSNNRSFQLSSSWKIIDVAAAKESDVVSLVGNTQHLSGLGQETALTEISIVRCA